MTLQICDNCGSIIPPVGEHDCHPKEKVITLTLKRVESFFVSWCQAYACAILAGNQPAAVEAFLRVRAYAEKLGVEGINDLGDRHALLAKASWPDTVQLDHLSFDVPKGVSQ